MISQIILYHKTDFEISQIRFCGIENSILYHHNIEFVILQNPVLYHHNIEFVILQNPDEYHKVELVIGSIIKLLM